jgi:uncharacterized protein (DUF2267 family)
MPIETVHGLAGVDTPEAMKLRRHLLKDNLRVFSAKRKSYTKEEVLRDISLSLVGCDSVEAWQLRQELKDRGADDLLLLDGIEGCDSRLAWELRQRCLEKKTMNAAVIESLAGIDSPAAWKLREELKAQVTTESYVESIVGNQNSFVWRLKNQESEKKEKESPKERREKYEKEILDAIEKETELSPTQIAILLRGCDSHRAHEMRRRISKNVDTTTRYALYESFTMCNSPESWQLRKELNIHQDILTIGGVQSKQAWRIRRDVLAHQSPARISDVFESIQGMDEPEAWKVRKEILNDSPSYLEHAIKSLTGIDSSEAWELRDRYVQTNEWQKSSAARELLLASVSGIDSSRAWKLRETLFNEKTETQAAVVARFLESLIGLDSPKAWQYRDEYLDVFPSMAAASLVGLDSARANDIRKKLMKKGVRKTDTLVGKQLWAHLPQFRETSEQESPAIQYKVDLLNLVHNPDLDAIQEYFQEHPEAKDEKPRLSKQHAAILGELLTTRDGAKAWLETNPAVPDRAPEMLAQQILDRVLPKTMAAERRRKQKAKEGSVWKKIKRAFTGTEPKPLVPVTQMIEDEPVMKLAGGGSESLADGRRVLEARENMDEMLVTGVYGKYNNASRIWEKVFFTASKHVPEPSRETTLTLVDVTGAGRVTPALPSMGRLISERVRGVTADGKEVSLNVIPNSLGEAAVDVPPGIQKILYSVELPTIAEPMADPTNREFETFLRTIKKEHGNDMTVSIARLPHEVEAVLEADEFKALSPKQKVIRIEELVRKISYYDVNNDEVSANKVGKTPEEQIAMCEQRLKDVHAHGTHPSYSGKKFAGVCTDCAQITCALLRKAGIPSGILNGFHIKGKAADMKHAHATAFVAWPDGRKGIRIVPVDGTPSSTEVIAADIARPSVAEAEKTIEEQITQEVVKAEEVIQKIVAAAKANDAQVLRSMTNGVLENAVNVILMHEVKRSHVEMIKRVLDAYWYAGIRDLGSMEGEIAMRDAFESEVLRQRAEKNESVKDVAAGTKLLETVRGFIGKFQKGNAASSRDEAYQVLRHISDLAYNDLSDVEPRAFIAVTEYLRAEKMQ